MFVSFYKSLFVFSIRGFYQSWCGGATDETSNWSEEISRENVTETQRASYKLSNQEQTGGESETY